MVLCHDEEGNVANLEQPDTSTSMCRVCFNRVEAPGADRAHPIASESRRRKVIQRVTWNLLSQPAATVAKFESALSPDIMNPLYRHHTTTAHAILNNVFECSHDIPFSNAMTPCPVASGCQSCVESHTPVICPSESLSEATITRRTYCSPDMDHPHLRYI